MPPREPSCRAGFSRLVSRALCESRCTVRRPMVVLAQFQAVEGLWKMVWSVAPPGDFR